MLDLNLALSYDLYFGLDSALSFLPLLLLLLIFLLWFLSLLIHLYFLSPHLFTLAFLKKIILFFFLKLYSFLFIFSLKHTQVFALFYLEIYLFIRFATLLSSLSISLFGSKSFFFTLRRNEVKEWGWGIQKVRDRLEGKKMKNAEMWNVFWRKGKEKVLDDIKVFWYI